MINTGLRESRKLRQTKNEMRTQLTMCAHTQILLGDSVISTPNVIDPYRNSCRNNPHSTLFQTNFSKPGVEIVSQKRQTKKLNDTLFDSIFFSHSKTKN